MKEQRAFARFVSVWLDERAGSNSPGYLDEILARTLRTRQRPAWSSLERWLPMETTLRLNAVPRFAWLFVVLTVVIALALIAVVGSRPHKLPSLFGPARNGTIVFGHGFIRWLGVVVFVMLGVAVWLRRRKPRAPVV